MNLLLSRFFLCLILISYFATIACCLASPPQLDSLSRRLLFKLPEPKSYEEAISLSEQYNNSLSRDTFLAYQQLAIALAKEAANEDQIMEAFMTLRLNYSAATTLGQFIEESKSLYQYVKRDSNRMQIDVAIANVTLRTGDFEQCRTFLDSAKIRLPKVTSVVLNRQYHYYEGTYQSMVKEDYLEAVVAFQESRRFANGDARTIAYINHSLSAIYSRIEDFESALYLQQENFDITMSLGDTLGGLYNIYALADTYGKLKRYPEMLAICQEGMRLQKVTGEVNSFGYLYEKLGQYYRSQDQLDSSVYYLTESILFNRAQEEKVLEQSAHIEMAQTQLALGELQKAAYHGELALDIGPSEGRKAERVLADVYAQQERFKEAYALQKIYLEDRAKKAKDRRNGQLISTLLEERYQQEEENRLRQFDNEVERQRNLTLFTILSVIIFLGGIFFWLVVRSRGRLQATNSSLQESNEALRQFAYITSHDLIEPIRNINSFSGLLARSLGGDRVAQPQRDYLQFISRSAAVLKEIVESLQIFIQSSFGELRRDVVQLEEVFSIVRNNVAATLKECNGQLSFDESLATTKVRYSESMLVLILQNLISNGLKYNESNEPLISVKVSQLVSDDEILFEVRDNGVGIDPKYQKDIFTPFKTLTNKSITQSSGLGLSICKTIIERYGGTISVKSNGGAGSTFYFTVPQ